jgi:hypothetical protein
MKMNHRREKRDKDGKKFDIDQWEQKSKIMKTERRERHKAKNQRAHQWKGFAKDDDLDD